MVPLISSRARGPLGRCQLPRTWWKVTLHTSGILDPEYPPVSWGLDKRVCDHFELDREATQAYVSKQRPSYMDFEAWVKVNAGNMPAQPQTDAYNEGIYTRRFERGMPYGDRKIAETYPDIGLDRLTVNIQSAMLLNNLQDWALCHQRDLCSDSVIHQLPNLCYHEDCGILGLPYLPKIWLHAVTGDPERENAGYNQEVAHQVLAGLVENPGEFLAETHSMRGDYLEFERTILTPHGVSIPEGVRRSIDQCLADNAAQLEHSDWQAWEQAHALVCSYVD